MRRTFDSVSIRREWGTSDAAGFHLHAAHRDALAGFPFSVCRIDGRQVAVFVDQEVPANARADLTSRKPDWLDAVVYARMISNPRSEIALIDAHVPSLDGADLGTSAFATACVAFNYGLFAVVPNSYVVRFGPQRIVRVSMAFDDDAQSWSGESTPAG